MTATKKFFLFLYTALISVLLIACAQQEKTNLVATTLPVYEFSARICEGTGISVSRLVTENVSCLHDYTLQTKQMRAIEEAEAIIISGGGLEHFLEDALYEKQVIDSSASISLRCSQEAQHHDHLHEEDPHFWLSPKNAVIMAENIASGLIRLYPTHEETFQANLTALKKELAALQLYGEETLRELKIRQLITFHDGFSYFAEAFDLTIIKAVEEESGSEASAKELIDIIQLARSCSLSAIFTERSGSTSAAQIISRETGIPIYCLDMAMSGSSYFDAMLHNINTVKEALS